VRALQYRYTQAMQGSTLVREARRRAGLLQRELAERVGTTQSAIARVESGATEPSLARVHELVRACGFDLHVRLVPADDTDVAAALRNRSLTPDERIHRVKRMQRFVEAGREAMARRG